MSLGLNPIHIAHMLGRHEVNNHTEVAGGVVALEQI